MLDHVIRAVLMNLFLDFYEAMHDGIADIIICFCPGESATVNLFLEIYHFSISYVFYSIFSSFILFLDSIFSNIRRDYFLFLSRNLGDFLLLSYVLLNRTVMCR